MADRNSVLGNMLSVVVESVALLLALLAVELTFGVWRQGSVAAGVWPGVLVAVAQLITATMATMLLAMYGRGYLLWRAVVLILGYLVAVFCGVQAFLG